MVYTIYHRSHLTSSAISMLQDESSTQEGDLYIRSICFSPDGRFLATGAEDKQIRVRHHVACFP